MDPTTESRPAPQWETKSMRFAPTAVTDRQVTGIFAVFGNRDAVRDIAHPGSFEHTFKTGGRKALYLWHHDMQAPPTAIINDLREVGREGLPDDVRAEYPEATGGAEVTRTYLDTPRGNEILAAIKAGAPLQQSYGFKAIRYEYKSADDGGRDRHLYEQRLGEVSDVTLGANPATRAKKSYPDFDTWLADLAEVLDEAGQFEALLHEIKAGARHSAADLHRLNAMHDHLLALGCTNCPGADATDARKAAPVPDLPADPDSMSRAADLHAALTPLADLQTKLHLFDLSLLGVIR